VSEQEFADALTWAICKMADGGGRGKCDPDHTCVCGAEGRFIAREIYGSGYVVHKKDD